MECYAKVNGLERLGYIIYQTSDRLRSCVVFDEYRTQQGLGVEVKGSICSAEFYWYFTADLNILKTVDIMTIENSAENLKLEIKVKLQKKARIKLFFKELFCRHLFVYSHADYIGNKIIYRNAQCYKCKKVR